MSRTRSRPSPANAPSAVRTFSSLVGSNLASLNTYQAFSAASITACFACSSSLSGFVVGGVGGVLVGAGSVVIGSVVGGGRIVAGVVFGTAALVAGGFALSPALHAVTASNIASVVTVHARARLGLNFFTVGGLHRGSGPFGLDRGRPQCGV